MAGYFSLMPSLFVMPAPVPIRAPFIHAMPPFKPTNLFSFFFFILIWTKGLFGVANHRWQAALCCDCRGKKTSFIRFQPNPRGWRETILASLRPSEASGAVGDRNIAFSIPGDNSLKLIFKADVRPTPASLPGPIDLKGSATSPRF